MRGLRTTSTAVIIALFMVFVAHVAMRSDQLPDGADPLVRDSSLYIPIWYFLVCGWGLVPTMLIGALGGKWTAPPFYYPPPKSFIVTAHAAPAMLWLVGSALQIFFAQEGLLSATADPWLQHRVLGMTGMTSIFVAFQITAIISLLADLSPLGRHVQFMEWNLALGSWLVFAAGLYYISTGPAGHTGHKICMSFVMLYASGPLAFRVLRHVRELLAGRLFSPGKFSAYSDLEGKRLKDMRNVESTYFCIAFLMTNAYAFLFSYQSGILLGDEKWLVYCLLILPIAGVLLGILMRFVPGISPDFQWRFQLDFSIETIPGFQPTQILCSCSRPVDLGGSSEPSQAQQQVGQ